MDVRVVTCTALLLVTAVLPGAGQRTDKPDATTRKVRFRGGDDPNVKPGAEVNVRAKPSDAAPPAGKAPTDRLPCEITFDNRTDLITKTYIDGQYAGTVRPYGVISAFALPGSAMLYARAEYDDGSADAWGPIRASCKTKYLWRLTD